MRTRASLGLWLVLALGACGGGGKASPPLPDADGDGISDDAEGASAAVDSDRDGAPDYLDPDSDGDTLPDAVEAGDLDVTSAPVDSDGDGVADFRDLDSDGNGRDDELEGAEDLDGDGQRDFADADEDGDRISDRDELGAAPMVAVDTDLDGTGDFRDLDSDGDGIADLIETSADYDLDLLANFRDLDSDADCRPDQVERGELPARDSDADRRYDFVDRDSDNDGVPDSAEDASCNGRRDGAETDATRADTDGDGATDLVERAAGTNPNDAADHPRARGDFVFVLPYQAPQQPVADNLDFRPALSSVDVYVVMDRSTSMSEETTSIKDSLGAVIRGLQCPPLGTGSAATCIPNLHAGLAGLGYRTDQPFVHYLPIQPSPDFAGTDLPNVTGQPPLEPMVFALWTAITNLGSAVANGTYGCALDPVAPNAACPPGRYGQACFRPGSLPVIVLATDEPPLQNVDGITCPGWDPVTRDALRSRKAKVVGVVGSGSASTLAEVRLDLRAMAADTGAVDASAGNAPLVFDGAGAGAANAIGEGIRALARGVPLDMGAVVADDPGDALDARAAFVDHLETLQLGNALCASGLTDVDSDGDTFRDRFVAVRAGVPLCWKLVTKRNTTVPALEQPQLFRARVDVVGDGVTTVDSREVFFLVPPRTFDEPIE